MRVSLPLRLFLVQLVFTIAAGFVAVKLVVRSFERYQETWERQVTPAFAAEMYRPMAIEISRSLLLTQEALTPEVRKERQERIAIGLRTVLHDIPSIRSIVVLDTDFRIAFASDATVGDLVFKRPSDRRFLAADTPQRRSGPDPEGAGVEELMIPVFDPPVDGAVDAPKRLGSILLRFVPDPALVARVRGEGVPSIPARDFALPVILFLAAAAAGALAVSALSALPLRRLERALQDLRQRDYRGRLDPGTLGLDDTWTAAVQAINDMEKARLEVMDARGKERDDLLEKLSQSLEEGMVALDPDGKPLVWNGAAVRLLAGRRPEDTPPESPETRASEEVRLTRALQANGAGRRRAGDGALPAASDVEWLRDDGTRTDVRLTEAPFQAEPGRQGTLLLIRDLTTLRTIESHLADVGRFAVVAHLAAGLAHEIRNPLHSIGINASVVEQYVSAEPASVKTKAMTESLETIRDETQRLATLLNSYLGLVRHDDASEPVDLEEVCRRVVQLLAFTARKAHVEIRMTVSGEAPSIRGAADRLQQAVLNLALNAVQAMPTGGVVTIDVGREEGWARITVSDTGPGIPKDLESGLFEKPLTTKTGGSGLGLPLVRMIAEAHGGTVRCGSNPGSGAAFTILLPPAGRR